MLLACGVTAILVVFPTMGLASNPTFTQTCFSNDESAAMTAGDFNGDGKLDIAINPGGSTSFPSFGVDRFVDVYLGNGDGTFSGPSRADAILPYLDISSADLNHDGNLDIVTSQLAVLLGNGNGTFQPAQLYPEGFVAGLAVVDFNRDGFADVAIPAVPTNGKGGGDAKYVSVRLNQGNGNLGSAAQYRAGDNIRALTGGDFNGDGIADIVSLDSGSNHNGVSVLLGKGDGKFQDHIDTVLPGFPGRGMATADFNGDGKLDLVVPLQGGAGVLVLVGNGNGTFGPAASYPMPGNVLHVAIGDVNGDGGQDIVAANYLPFYPSHGGSITVLYGNGSGGFSPAAPINVAYGLGVLTADVNADSRLDIVADACVLLNNGAIPAAAANRSFETMQPRGDVLQGAIGPNPMRDRGTLTFRLPVSGLVSVHVYDVRGRRVGSLLDNAWLPAGSHSFAIHRTQIGRESGLYFYRLESPGIRAEGRLILVD